MKTLLKIEFVQMLRFCILMFETLMWLWLTGRMKLYEFEILIGQISSRDHGSTVAGASVRRGAGEVRTSVTTGSENRVLSVETMNSSVLET